MEVVTTVLANRLAQEPGYRVGILSLSTPTLPARLPLSPAVEHVALTDIAPTDAKRLAGELRKVIARRGVDTLIYQYIYNPILHPIIAGSDGAGARRIVVVHNEPFMRELDTRGNRRYGLVRTPKDLLRRLLYPLLAMRQRCLTDSFHRFVLRHADKICLLAPCYAAELAERMHLSEAERAAKLCAIYNPITVATPAVDAAELFAAKRNEVLYAARLTQQKGAHLILDIWRHFAKARPDWTLRIVGDGEERTAMERRVKREGLTGVRFEGYQADMTPYYRSARFVCLASWIEGAPLVITEGMAWGCIPCTFDSYGAASDLIDDDADGLVVTMGDTQGYAERLGRIADNRPTAEAMARNALAKSRRFDTDRIAADWKRLLESDL
jgi:glycosyltransferase involved in cell wall biosynthesis